MGKTEDQVKAAAEKAKEVVEKAADAVKGAVEKAGDVAQEVVDKVKGVVEVELADAEGVIGQGLHEIYTSKGVAQFIDGKARVLEAVAEELKSFGQVK